MTSKVVLFVIGYTSPLAPLQPVLTGKPEEFLAEEGK
jgi:hypothetical protein